MTKKKKEEEGERSNTNKYLKTTLIKRVLKKSAHMLFDAWSLLLVHVLLTPTQGLKGL
jgi:hypothetical protein